MPCIRTDKVRRHGKIPIPTVKTLADAPQPEPYHELNTGPTYRQQTGANGLQRVHCAFVISAIDEGHDELMKRRKIGEPLSYT